jgi:tellurite resistance protein TerC
VLLWLVFVAIVGVLLLCYRRTSAATGRRAAAWTVAWSVGAFAFAGLVYPLYEYGWLGATLAEPSVQPGADAATMFVSAYLVEYAIAFGNVVLISRVCQRHRIRDHVRSRVIFWGLVGTILVHALILAAVTLLARTSGATLSVLGVLVAFSFVLLGSIEDDEDVRIDSDSAVVQRNHMQMTRLLWFRGRLTDSDSSGRFWGRKNGRRALTLAGACVLTITLGEAATVLDSAVMVPAISRTTFIVVAANVVATIGALSWFSRREAFEDLRFPRFSVSALLVVIAIKLLARDHVPVSHVETLAVITALVGAGVAEMLLAARRARRVNRP